MFSDHMTVKFLSQIMYGIDLPFAEIFWGDFDPCEVNWFDEHMDPGQKSNFGTPQPTRDCS